MLGLLGISSSMPGTNRYEADTWKKDNVLAEDGNDNFDLDDDFAKKLGEFFS